MDKRTIRSPAEWAGAQVINAAHLAGATGHALHHALETLHSPAPAIRRITFADLGEALTKGWQDSLAYRTDVFFLVFIYPLLNIGMFRVAFGLNLLPLLFPLAAGFALLGPAAAVGLYEMSRRRELGQEASWRHAFDVLQRPAIGGIFLLSCGLLAVFVAWLATAWRIYLDTMGPALPSSLGIFLNDVIDTGPGQNMAITGIAVGGLFALFILVISVVSFPMMVDRDAGVDTAVRTSLRAVQQNPLQILAWGAIVALLLLLGSLPAFLGLVVVIPVLGHGTWHLYRKLVEP